MTESFKQFEMNYGQLSTLCEIIETHLKGARIGDNLHDIGSPLASKVRNYCTEEANKFYAA